MHQRFKRKTDRRFQARDAEGATLELLHLVIARVRRVIGRDGIDCARDNAFDHSIDIDMAAQRRLHFVIAVIADQLRIGQDEVVRAWSPRSRGGPRDLANATMATELRVERCATWKARASQVSARMISRATITSSELEGMPPRPRRVETDAFVHIAAGAQVSGLRSDRSRAYRATARTPWRGASRASSSPAGRHRKWRRCRRCFMEAIAASSSPAEPFVMAPMGSTLTMADCLRARRRCSW